VFNFLLLHFKLIVRYTKSSISLKRSIDMIKVFLEKVLFFALALIGILFLITIHEFGHWSFSKIFNVATPVFSIGFGPKLLSTRIADTEFVLAALPLGGYVSIAGLDSMPRTANAKKSQTQAKKLFTSKPYYQKALIILGGILFNILFGFLALALTGSEQTKQALNQLFKTLQQKESGGFIGPIGIITLITQSARIGFKVFLLLLGILSINLAFINLLPIPFLDGGQLLALTLTTMHISTPTSIRDSITSILLLLLILFIIYITVKDIKRLRNY
jgi:membrane-associated protease RseP (regulator of RpoE activity)